METTQITQILKKQLPLADQDSIEFFTNFLSQVNEKQEIKSFKTGINTGDDINDLTSNIVIITFYDYPNYETSEEIKNIIYEELDSYSEIIQPNTEPHLIIMADY